MGYMSAAAKVLNKQPKKTVNHIKKKKQKDKY